MTEEKSALEAAARQRHRREHHSEQASEDAGVPTVEDEERTGLAGVAATIVDVAGPVISGARRLIGQRSGARIREVSRMGRQLLPNLWEVHPEARRASIRELGLLSILVSNIVGTAVEGPAQRGGDFLPLRDRRSDDWRSRWQRILRGIDDLATLPPVELMKFGDEYWVVDGHNRVAAALYTGQVEIDAIVQQLRLPGMRHEPPTLIAPVLEGSLDLRNAGAGRFSRTATRRGERLPIQMRNDDHEEVPG